MNFILNKKINKLQRINYLKLERPSPYSILCHVDHRLGGLSLQPRVDICQGASGRVVQCTWGRLPYGRHACVEGQVYNGVRDENGTIVTCIL